MECSNRIEAYNGDPQNKIAKKSNSLDICSVWYYVLGGLTSFAGIWILVMLIFANTFLNNIPKYLEEAAKNEQQKKDIAAISVVFEEEHDKISAGLLQARNVGVTIGLIVLLLGIYMIIVGVFLQHRRNYLACQILTLITCLIFPVGTILGICTTVALARPDIKRSFSKTKGELG